MRKILFTTVAVAAALVPVSSSVAAPRLTPGFASGCRAATVDNGSTVSGYLYGSVAATDLPADADLVAITLTCSVQSTSYAHPAPDDFTAAKSGSGAVVLKPKPFTVPAPGDDLPVGVCTRVDVTDGNGAVHTFWSHSQNSTWRTTDDGTCGGAPTCLAFSAECVWWLALVDELT